MALKKKIKDLDGDLHMLVLEQLPAVTETCIVWKYTPEKYKWQLNSKIINAISLTLPAYHVKQKTFYYLSLFLKKRFRFGQNILNLA